MTQQDEKTGYREGFWKEKWEKKTTAWHMSSFHPHLLEYGPEFFQSNQDRKAILVPLCGKTKDLIWFVLQGFDVVGIEIVEQPLQEFVEENKDLFSNVTTKHLTTIPARLTTFEIVEEKRKNNAKIFFISGDFFSVDSLVLCEVIGENFSGQFDFVFDRAALIALPSNLREPYVSNIASLLKSNGKLFLISLIYDQEIKTGPPWVVSKTDVRSLFHQQSGFRIDWEKSIPSKGTERKNEVDEVFFMTRL